MEDLSNNSAVPSTPKIDNTRTTECEVKESSPDRRDEAEICLAEGAECLKTGETERALDLLSRALELATKTKGELDTSLYRFYFTYADALILNHERENAGKMFGDLVPEEVPVSSSQSENKDESEENEAADDQNSSEYSPENPQEALEGAEVLKSSSENNGSQEEEEESGEEEEGSGDEEESGGEEESGEEDNREVEEIIQSDPRNLTEQGPNPTEQELPGKPDDLEIAWECLESARVILKKSSEIDLFYLTKVITRLGDLLSYKEEFEKANEEYSTSLQLLFSAEGEISSRNKAELYFLMGNNFLQVRGKENEAASHFTSAIDCLERVKQGLTDISQREELEDILKEVRTKRDDALEQKQSITALEAMENTEPNAFDTPSLNNIIDLGVLGKRKREDHGDPSFPDKNDDKKPIN